MASAVGKTWVIPRRVDGTLWMADIVPVLTGASVGSVTTTSGVGSVTVSRSGGTLYVVLTGSPVAPSAAQIIAGQNNLGVAALRAASQVVLSIGAKTFSFTGLSGTAAFYAYYVHVVGGFTSNVIASAAFTLLTSGASWRTTPDVTITRPFSTPQYINNIRSNYLSDPSGVIPANGISVQGADANVSYDSVNDRLVIATDPGADGDDVGVFMRATDVPNALTDWITRSTASGVTAAVRFGGSNANVNAYRHGNSGSAEPGVTWNSTGGIIGDGCLRINDPASEPYGPYRAWRIPLNLTWNQYQQGFGVGVPFYVQYRCRISPNGLVASNGGEGRKFSIISGVNPADMNSSQASVMGEIVMQNQYYQGIPQWYRQEGSYAAFTYNYSWLGDQYSYTPQNAVDHGSGTPRDRYCISTGGASPGCWFFRENEWFTAYFEITIQSPTGVGGVGNRIRVSMARQGETSYTTLLDVATTYCNFNGLDPEILNGHNGLWLTTSDTNRINAPYDTWQDYDQIIVSTQPIACPQV